MRLLPPRRPTALVAVGAGLLAGLATLGPSAPAAAAAATTEPRPFSCLPANGLSTLNRGYRLLEGRLVLPGGEVDIGRSAPINWGMDPYRDGSWTKWFLSLKWVEALTQSYQRTGRQEYLDRAVAIAVDFALVHPAGGGPNPPAAWNGMYAGQRATVYTCLDMLAPGNPVIRDAILRHGDWLARPANDPGDWNQGVDAAIGLLGAGCRTGEPNWTAQALARFNRIISVSVDPEGAFNEQAPGYASYVHNRWGLAERKIAECGQPVPSEVAERRPLMRDFLAWSTQPDGRLVQLGDTYATAGRTDEPSLMLEYALTGGRHGAPPSERAKVFSAGYVFGRNTWAPFTSSTHYSLRFGPGRRFHGHDDHTALTLHALGRPLLVDSGHYGYTAGAYRDYLRGPTGHNVLVMPGARFNAGAPTSLSRMTTGKGWRFFELADAAWDRRLRTRGVLVDEGLSLFAVYDRAHRATPGSFQQLWHLAPGARVKVSGRSRATAVTQDGGAQLTLLQVPLPGQTVPPGSTGVVSGRTKPYQGWVSTESGKRTPAPVVVLARSGHATEQLTLLAPTKPGVAVNASAAPESDGSIRVDVSVGSAKRTLRVGRDGGLSEDAAPMGNTRG